MASVALVAVASKSYRAFAEDLMESARELIDGTFSTHILDGVEGFPIGTECRHGIFAGWLATQTCDVAFLLDADMLVGVPFDIQQLVPSEPGIVATQHPGYLNMPREMLPYESRPESSAFIPPGSGDVYYCGGVVGGTREAMLELSSEINDMILMDREAVIEIVWHDESCLNAILAWEPPVLTLSPEFCHPDHDAHYVNNVWGGKQFERKIVALDKSPAERVGR